MPKLFVLASLFLALAPAASMAQECVARPYRLKIDIDAPREVIDRSRDTRTLSGMLSERSLPGYVTQGLTKVDYTASYTTEYLSQQREDGSWCSTVDAVTVRFGFLVPPTIYIARSLPEGGCMYNEVMKHEYQHLRIAQNTLEAGRKWIGSALKQELSKGGAVGPSATAANAEIESGIKGIVNKITGGLYATARFKNLALDTPENYARLGKVCG
ncbi:hypothetical protein HFN89_04150 [Rhizobium laguerreae]|nr:hypothetical protein [Rhizobium laguerreae]